MNALITGASKGIGRAVALRLAANNYNLALCARDQKDLDLLAEELGTSFPGGTFHLLKADLADPEELETFARSVHSRFNTLDVLVNNAGLYIPSQLLDEEPDVLIRQMTLNVYAPYYLCRFFGNEMRKAGCGHIFNICSVASIKPFVNAGSYSVTKSALLGLTKVLREELMPYRVKVTAVLPGATLTESWGDTGLPASRFVDPDDVALAILNSLKMSKGANADEIIIRPVEGEI